VILGEGAKVEGQIEGNRVVISGRFDGVIFAKGRVEIEAKGVVTGEVHSRAWSSIRAESSTGAATCWDLRKQPPP